MIDQAVAELEPLLGTAAACRLTGKPRATLYRHRNPRPRPFGPRRPVIHPAALSAAEREGVLAVLRSDRFADKSPAQVWAILLDEGTYLCSISTMYRLLRQHGEVRERRRQATHPPRKRPELMATGPNQVWSWDVTKLKGPWKGVYHDLMVMIDIFSRKAVHWKIVPESGANAKTFQEEAFTANGGIVPTHVHADNGPAMTSKDVAQLLEDLKITRSHSRPHVSNDNPYSESNFKTLKYCPAFPGHFDTPEAAARFCQAFFTHYNDHHRHSGIGLHTPASVHDGTAVTIRRQRAEVLTAAYAANPGRFHARPTPPKPPTKVFINKPPKENPETEQAA
ncbi:DDE-type integrase/transposase/recombinase [Actinomadura harenae]|uniref:IS3 family transposase n=1 Tax=Actinomadura harenae TaxID=2483351 RepID=A0A3M2KTR8_9ACTN|nr:DDE-type integrase/transposase/recombinase [Actinomadura harenae]RMI29047.1 IS3 family transposase [Actinomadura harenae]